MSYKLYLVVIFTFMPLLLFWRASPKRTERAPAVGNSNGRKIPLSRRRLPWARPLRSDVHGIERLAGGHEQAISFGAAKAEIGGNLRQTDAADQLALGGPDGDPVIADGTAGIARAPQIAINIAACAVRAAFDPVDHEIAKELLI